MKICKNSFFTFLMITASIVFAQAQTTSEEGDEPKKAKAIEKADAHYESGEYSLAILQYKKAYSKTKERTAKAENLFRTAECYRLLGDCKTAEAQYKRAYKMKYGSIALLRYAEMIKCKGEYEDAIVEYQNYRNEVPDDPRGEEGIEACKMALNYIQNPSRYIVTNMKTLNTKERDFATAYSAKRADDYGELYFASSREGSYGTKESPITGQLRPDIYSVASERKKKRGRGAAANTGYEAPNFSVPVPVSDMINTEDSEGPMCFDSRRKTLYFTRCENIKFNSLGCGIWMTKKMGQDYAEPEQVILVEDSSKSVGHPSLSPDDQILYFAGDLDGAVGGKDLWMTTYDRRAKRWKEPTNLGSKINTAEDELFPFAHDDGYLYFSSNGHPGMGGLDIFRIKLNEEGMPEGEVENMGYPINTNSEDFGIIFENGKSAKGYMASDRIGAGNDDIYSVYLVPLKFTLDGVITSTKNGKPIDGVTVTITGTDGNSHSVNSDDKGYYKFDHDVLNEETTYKLHLAKDKYLVNEYDMTTVGVDMNSFEFIPSENIYLHGLKLNMEMDPIEVPIVLPNILFDRAKWDLKPESMASLDTVFQILERNPNIVIELRSHTDYRDTEEKNDVLSLNRADTCVKYLITKGIEAERMVPVGRGEHEPFIIPENYKASNADYDFKPGTELTEKYIRSLTSKAKQDAAHQLNRRTDMKVLRDDYVSGKAVTEEGGGTKEEEGKPEGEFYTVQPRDSWGKIAKAAGITVVDLKKLNGGLRGARAVPGMILKITKDADYSEFDASHYQAKNGDNYAKVAKATGVDKKTLKDLNPDITDKNMAAGMYIRFK